MFYVRNNFNPVQLLKPYIANIDTVYLQLREKDGTKITIVLIYRPPAQPVQTDCELFEQINEICNRHDTVIFRDFNLTVLSWGKPINLHNGYDLYANFKESSLTQLVQSPTRVDNILDLGFTTKEYLVQNLTVGDESSNSD